MSTIQVETLKNPTTLNSVNTDDVISGSAKILVNFNGTGTLAIRESYNVSSVVDNGTGDYTVNYSITLDNLNYMPIIYPESGSSSDVIFSNVQAANGSMYRFRTRAGQPGVLTDQVYVTFAVFGGV